MGYTMVCSACAVVQDRVCSSERRELGVGGDDAGQRQGLEEGVGSFWYSSIAAQQISALGHGSLKCAS